MADLESLQGKNRVQRARVGLSRSPIWPSEANNQEEHCCLGQCTLISPCAQLCARAKAKSMEDKMNVF